MDLDSIMSDTTCSSLTTAPAVNSVCLLQLPDEILVLILRNLDLADQVNVYETCRRISEVMVVSNMLRQPCRLGCGPLATADSLRLPFFRNLGFLIKELDMTCVSDLTRTKLLPAIKRMPNLIALDVSRTGMNLIDLPHLAKACPRLTKICINIDWKKVNYGPEAVEPLKHMEIIHIISACPNSLSQPVLQYFLQLDFSNLKELHFTCNQTELLAYHYVELFAKTKAKMIAFHANFEAVNVGSTNLDILNNWEYVFIARYEICPRMYMSSKLYRAFQRSDHVGIWDVHPMRENSFSNTKWSWYLWRHDLVCFNENFLYKFFREIGEKLIHKTCLRLDMPCGSRRFAKFSSSSYYLSACTFEPELPTKEAKFVPPTKKRYSKVTNLEIKLDTYVKPNREIELTLGRNCDLPVLSHRGSVRIRPGSTQMKNITFLHLHDMTSVDQYFFRELFKECEKLKTLNVDNYTLSTCPLLLCNSISMTKSLRNLRVCGAQFSNSKLYESLSTCSSLENVHICDTAEKTSNASDDSLLSVVNECLRLYSFRLYCDFNSSTHAQKQLKLLKAAASKINNKVLHVEFHHIHTIYSYRNALNIDPYIDVFFHNSIYKTIHLDLKFPPENYIENLI